MSALSPTPLPTTLTAGFLNRPLSSMSQPVGVGYLQPGALLLPGTVSSQSAYLKQVIHNYLSLAEHFSLICFFNFYHVSFLKNGYINGPVCQSSPCMLNNNSTSEAHYYNQY